jgi:hypothetical protein
MKIRDSDGLDGLGSFPVIVRFSLLHKVQTDSGAHPTSYLIGMGGGGVLSLGVKRQGSEAGHSPPSSAVVEKVVALPPLPNTSSRHST